MKTLLMLCGLVIGANAFAAEPGYHVIKKLPLGGEGGANRWHPSASSLLFFALLPRPLRLCPCLRCSDADFGGWFSLVDRPVGMDEPGIADVNVAV